MASVATAAAALTELSRRRSARAEAGDPRASRIEAELALGRQIQRSFVPLVPPDIPGYEVASHYEPAREVGGDFFDVFRIRAGRGGWPSASPT